MTELETKLHQIFSTLKSNLQEAKAMGGDKNSIDTTAEKNKVAELLAGAKLEIGDLFSSFDTSNSSLVEDTGVKELQKQANEQLANLQNALYNELEDYEYTPTLTGDSGFEKRMFADFKNGHIEKRPEVKHIYNDGRWDKKEYEIENVGYSAEVFGTNGKLEGLKLYKNDNQVYKNPDFAAKHLGLKKKEDSSWEITKFFVSNNSLKQIDKGFYYKPYGNDEFKEVYQWDAESDSFKLVKESEPREGQITIKEDYSREKYYNIESLNNQIENLNTFE